MKDIIASLIVPTSVIINYDLGLGDRIKANKDGDVHEPTRQDKDIATQEVRGAVNNWYYNFDSEALDNG